jgi:ferredoxin
MTTPSDLQQYLDRRDDNAWRAAASDLLHETHRVDHTAVRIWLAFFPLALRRALASAARPDELAYQLLLDGRYQLEDQIDSAHRFFYGHRYWPVVKQAVIALATRARAPLAGPLAALVREVAHDASHGSSVDRLLLTGISLVGLHTLQHVGLDRFTAGDGAVSLPARTLAQTPDQVLRLRARDDSQGPFGFLRGERKLWTVTFDEHDPEARFPLTHTQALTTAAAEDTRNWRARDARCVEGPIPVQCRSASCGTCWVGVLGGGEKLSPVEPRERNKLTECGYNDTDDPRPTIRLACQAQVYGAVSIVIPPWNGVFGRVVRERARAQRAANAP